MKALIALLSTLALLPSSLALACSCNSGPIDPHGVLEKFLTERYGAAAAQSAKIERRFRYSLLQDKILYLLEGNPKPSGGNCWFKNELGQPLFQCPSKLKIQYDVTVPVPHGACRQYVTVTTTEKTSKIHHSPATCVAR